PTLACGSSYCQGCKKQTNVDLPTFMFVVCNGVQIFLQTFAFSIIANKESGSLPPEFVNYQIVTVLAVQKQTGDLKLGQKVDGITLVTLPPLIRSVGPPPPLLPSSFLYLLSSASPFALFPPMFLDSIPEPYLPPCLRRTCLSASSQVITNHWHSAKAEHWE
ncbi:hypothetical protein KUCAC02_023931, partial [Chaenocephalus aceratus]